jgi:hypothetical protein
VRGPIRFHEPARTPEPAAGTRTSGLPGVVQGVISRRPSVRAISVDRMSDKNASAKQTHD